MTGFNCGYILSFSNLMLVPLGWTWGIICLSLVGLYTAYANWLLAAFHFINGHRFIRYRDIMGYLFGLSFLLTILAPSRKSFLLLIYSFDHIISTLSSFSLCVGRKMYYITWVFQFFTLLLGNMGFILLGGRALKACDAELRLIKPFLCNLFYMHFDYNFTYL